MMNIYSAQKGICDRKLIPICFGFCVMVFFCFIALWIGKYPISFEEYEAAILSYFGIKSQTVSDETIIQVKYIIKNIRFPRILSAVFIGASLSVSGAVFQGIFVNPLVSPGILGVLSGASFGAALGMLLRSSTSVIQILAFCFAFLAVLLSLGISKMYSKGSGTLVLVLGGIISSALFGAMLALIKFTADPYNVLPEIVYWLMGSLASQNIQNLILCLPWMFISIILLALMGKQLNILSLGEEEASALGINVEKIRFTIIVLATILGALSVMLAGVIGWIGLVVPHIARMLIGANHLYLIPMCAVIGSLFLLTADTLARSIFITEIPVGIITSVIGILIFIFVLNKVSKNV